MSNPNREDRRAKSGRFGLGLLTLRRAAVLAALALLQACATNPVTGQRELTLVSEAQERQIGQQQYSPSRQMQGGDYITDPALVEYVQAVGAKLAKVSDRPLDYEFQVLNNGVPNAWALPGGKIAINRGLLLEMNSEAELAAVLGHEIVHAAARHGAKGLERGILLQGAVVAAAIASRNSDYSQYVVGGAQVGAQLLNQKYGRGAELESDRYGMIYMSRAGYDPQGAVDLQKTFVRLSEGRRQDWLSGLFASHPPSQARVEQNQKTAAELGTGGFVGRDEYQERIARLRRTKPAYDDFDQARKSLSEGDARKAANLARKAIRLEPEEAQFYGLLGDVSYADRKYRDAVKHYSEALRRDNNYFKYYLGRGESSRRLNQNDQAREDLVASAKLLPTADAYNSLGQLAASEGDTSRAIEFYEVAASSNTPAGQNATAELIRLDLPQRPERYVNALVRYDQSGRVYVELQNKTSVPLNNVVVDIYFVDGNGRQQQLRRRYPQALPGRQNGIIVLGNQYASVIQSMKARVSQART